MNSSPDKDLIDAAGEEIQNMPEVRQLLSVGADVNAQNYL
jgi:hypothetical protein